MDIGHNKIVCMTPIRNESWILNRFLKATSLWANEIILCDQSSEDNSREIASRFEKAIIIENIQTSYDENFRQKLLLHEARASGKNKILFALDADEFLSGNFRNSAEWDSILTAPPGTTIWMRWKNITSDMQSFWFGDYLPFGYVDDGIDHQGKSLHSFRVPISQKNNIYLNEISVLHYAYTDYRRARSKHRYYQILEFEKFNKNPVEIYRAYSHSGRVKKTELFSLDPRDLSVYAENGIDMTSVLSFSYFWWDYEVLKLLEKKGSHPFRYLDIWDMDWQLTAHYYNLSNAEGIENLRYAFGLSSLMQRYLRYSNRFYPSKVIFIVDFFLSLFLKKSS
jgi:hypothetical protein